MFRKIFILTLAIVFSLPATNCFAKTKVTKKPKVVVPKKSVQKKKEANEEFVELLSKKLADAMYEQLVEDERVLATISSSNEDTLLITVSKICEIYVNIGYTSDSVRDILEQGGIFPSDSALDSFMKETKKPLIEKTTIYLYQKLLPLVSKKTQV